MMFAIVEVKENIAMVVERTDSYEEIKEKFYQITGKNDEYAKLNEYEHYIIDV